MAAGESVEITIPSTRETVVEWTDTGGVILVEEEAPAILSHLEQVKSCDRIIFCLTVLKYSKQLSAVLWICLSNSTGFSC